MKRHKNEKSILDGLIDAVLLDMSQGVDPTFRRKSEFRISGFPYCPIRSLLFKGDGFAQFRSEFYTSIGTAVHNTLQKYLRHGNFKDKIFACWKIVETGEIIGPCKFSDIPAKYHNYTIEYEEITINYNGLSGHVDLVIEILPGKYIVIDFKTTNLRKTQSYREWQKYYPASRSSIMQISAYSTLLKTQFGLNIVAWCLVYIDRGDVINDARSFHKVLRPWNKKKHNQMLGWIDLSCKSNKLLQKLNKILESGKTKFSERANELLEKIIRNRPCQSEEDYAEFMDYKFYKGKSKFGEDSGVKNGDCVLLKSCLKGNKSCRKAINQHL
jgi:hypothetical protein